MSLSDAPTAAVEAHVVHKAFGGLRAVDGASLRLERGQIGALLGPSGSGKTTLLRLVAGFERPAAGLVRLGGPGAAPARGRVGSAEPPARGVVHHGGVFPPPAPLAHLGLCRKST